MTDPAQQRADFRWTRPEQFNFALDVIDNWAQLDPDLLALRWIDGDGGDAAITYRGMALRSRQVAAMLAAQGIGPGDRLIVILGREIAWWEVMTACLRAGIVVAPATVQLSAKDIAYRIEAAGAVGIVTDRQGAEKVDAVLEQCPALRSRIMIGGSREGWVDYDSVSAQMPSDFEAVPTRLEDPALCYFTSGTTGYPKMVVHNQGYGLAHQTTGRFWLDLKPGDLHWNVSDTGWAKAAWSSYFGPWQCGACVLVHGGAVIDPGSVLATLAQLPVVSLCAAPTLYRMLVQHDLSAFRAPTLQHCVGAGEPLNPEVIETWRQASGITIRDGYGQTESVILCGTFPGMEVRFGSMGQPAPGIDLAVIDGDGNPVGVDQEGDIAVRIRPEHPLGLFHGYEGGQEGARDCFLGDWYLTGDRATRDADGYFWFVGRSDDVIISSGYRIGPFEVESALIEHPAVAESAVISSPDPVRGEVVKAFVILAPGFEAGESLVAELQDHVKRVTAPYKYPRKIEFVTALPKTVSGKIRRVELRDREWAAASV